MQWLQTPVSLGQGDAVQFLRTSGGAFIAVFAADLIDKGSLLAALCSARASPVAVFVGAATAMLMSCTLWVFAGQFAGPLIQARWVRLILGCALIAAGVLILRSDSGGI